MTESYLQYWGLNRHPFLMAPDSNMMYVAGQYYECLERLKYAVNTRKGGALLISEDAGLGKTTVLLKLIDGMKEEYGDTFRYALVDHPTLTDSQIIAHIAASISGETPYDDKLKNLTLLKEALIDVQKRGGKSIIAVDEGQMLCEAKDILQELRILINLTHENDYLHTFILSGQRALWNTIKAMPEFWQRLPVRYFSFLSNWRKQRDLSVIALKKLLKRERKRRFLLTMLSILSTDIQRVPREPSLLLPILLYL